MHHRAYGTVLLATAALLGLTAASFGFDPCLAASIAIGVGMIGLIVLVTARARQRLAASRAELMRAAQMCPNCGYTIRVDTDRCPECGTPRL